MDKRITKKQAGMLWTHRHAKTTEFSQLYKSCSDNKKHWANICEHEYIEMNGFHKRYHGGGSYFFQFSFYYIKDNKLYLHYRTAFNIYDFAIADLDAHCNYIYYENAYGVN